MKKSIIVSVITLLTVLSCQNPATFSAEGSQEERGLAAPTGTRTYLENFIDNRLLAGAGAEIGYSNAELGYSNVWIHYGFNGWQNPQDVQLQITGPSDPFLWAKINVPAGATVLDYCAYAIKADGTKLWDNNSGRDWHVPVYTSLVNVNGSQGLRAITYIGRLSNAKIHWGRSGWQTPVTSSLTKSVQTLSGGYSKWTGSIGSFTTTEVMNFCFTDGSGTWDNNAGKDWVNAGDSTTILVLPNQYNPDLEGAIVTGYVNGLYAGNWSLYSATSSFRAYASGKTGDWTLILDHVINGRRYTGTVSKRIAGVSDTLVLPVDSVTWNQ